MKRLDRKGFTLVEVLAVVVILGVLATIMVPTVSYVINQNKEDNYKNLEKSIISAAKVYMSDNRYNITLDSNTQCDSDNDTRSISSINNQGITNNKLTISLLELSGNDIKNPKNNKQILNKETSYVIVKYSCESRDYIYSCFDDNIECKDTDKSHLVWSDNN